MSRQSVGSILEFQEVSFRYPDNSLALDRCSLSIPGGRRIALLGANGAGKTTFFLHCNGILRPQNGTVRYAGAPVDYSRQGLHRLRSEVGMVFQNPDNQLFSASVREDVSFGPINLGLSQQAVRERVAEALATVEMTDCADKPVHNLSYGQKKRVCIAGVLAMRPAVLLLDEPMSGLDAVMQNRLAQVLLRLHTEGMSVILATHDLAFAREWAEQSIVLDHGRCPDMEG